MQPHRAKHGAKQTQGRLKAPYLRVLEKALRYRKTTCLLGAVLLAGSMMLFPLLPTGFMPKGDIGMSQIDVQLPPSSTLQQTDAYMRKIEQTLRQYDEVAHVFTTAGSGGEVAKGEILIRLKPHDQRSVSQKAFEDKARDALAQFSDIRFAFRNEMAQRDVSILLTGTNPQLLTQTAQTLKSQMQGLPSVKNVQINAPLIKSELQVKLLADEAAKMGVTPQAVGNLLRIATVGDTDANAARFTFPDRQVPIRVVLAEQARNDLATLRRLQITTSNGGTVALENVARLEFGEGAASLERFDRERRIAVEADLTTGATIGDALAQVNALPVLQNLPDGVRMPDYGDAEYMNEMFEKFGAAMGFGILMLMGIVTKNSILLVDFVIEKRSQGMPRLQALIQSGAERARPILMTTIAMVAGMVPAVFAGGSGAAFRAPMAVAVICGLIASTLLSLIFVPVMYSLMDDLRNWLAPTFAKLTSVTAEDRAMGEKANLQCKCNSYKKRHP